MSSHCAPISSFIRLCWADLLGIYKFGNVIALILLVAAYFLLGGVPLTVRLCKILGRKRTKSSPSSSASISLRHIVSPHHYTMSPRRQDSEETLFDGSSNDGSGYDKLDCVPLDPFLIVQASLDDSLLVKQGLVEETVPPPPTHDPHDIQGPPPLVGRRDNTSSRTKSKNGTISISIPQSRSQRGSIYCATPTCVSSPREGRMSRDGKFGDSRETQGSGDTVPVPPPPPAYTPLPVGQRGRHRISCEVA